MTDQMKTALALATGRDAIRRMQSAASDAEYLDAAAQLADAFETIDKIVRTERNPR